MLYRTSTLSMPRIKRLVSWVGIIMSSIVWCIGDILVYLYSDLCVPERARDRSGSCQEGIVSRRLQPLQENISQPASLCRLLTDTVARRPVGCHGWRQQHRSPLQTVDAASSRFYSKRWQMKLLYAIHHNTVSRSLSFSTEHGNSSTAGVKRALLDGTFVIWDRQMSWLDLVKGYS